MDDAVLQVMTWNIHGGVGLDGVRDFQRVADLIASLKPDILALQEVDRRTPEAPLLALLQKEFVYQSVSATSIQTADGEYGQMLLSRWPVDEANVHDISVQGYEPRRLISAIVQSPAGPVHVLATHLGLRFAERRAQAAILCELANHPGMTTLALGDFNDWSRWHSIQTMMGEVFPARTTQRTFPSRLPLLALDRIYCLPAECLVQSHVVADAAMLSDHLPLVASVRVSCGRQKKYTKLQSGKVALSGPNP
jgi:endonuclease/exonuclease/phosphatase family metal-dependent hydrolase